MVTLSEFKELLQITNSDYDNTFEVYEPVVDDVVTDITKVRYGLMYSVATTENSNVITTDDHVYDDDVFTGADVSASNIPDDTHVWDWNEHSITVDKKATASGSDTLTVNSVPSGLKLAVCKMILFDIKNSTTSKANLGDITSKNMGVMSVSFGDATQIDKKYGYPKALIGAVKRYKRAQIDVGRKRYPYVGTTNRWY